MLRYLGIKHFENVVKLHLCVEVKVMSGVCSRAW